MYIAHMCLVPAVTLQVEYAREWLEQHLAHLMPNPPAGFTMEDQSSMERLHKTATYVLEVRPVGSAVNSTCQGVRGGKVSAVPCRAHGLQRKFLYGSTTHLVNTPEQLGTGGRLKHTHKWGSDKETFNFV